MNRYFGKFRQSKTRFPEVDNSLTDEQFLRTYHPLTKHRSLQRIAFDERVLVRNLPNRVTKTAQYLLRQTANSCWTDDSLDNEINLIYSLHHSFKRGESHPKLADLQNNLTSYDAFIKAYGPERTRDEQRNLIDRIGRFAYTSIAEYRRRSISPQLGRWKYDYSLQGEWCRVDNFETSRSYVGKPIIDEIKFLDEKLETASKEMVFHNSGSAALGGIAQHGALLSARQLLHRGAPIISGEYIAGVDSSSRGRGLANIYAHHNVSLGYSTVRWFEEFPICFGISREGLREHAASTNQRINIDDWWEDGYTIGTEVPLNLVKNVYAPHVRLGDMTEWRDQNCPSASLISLEAPREAYWVQKAVNLGTLAAPAVIR